MFLKFNLYYAGTFSLRSKFKILNAKYGVRSRSIELVNGVAVGVWNRCLESEFGVGSWSRSMESEYGVGV